MTNPPPKWLVEPTRQSEALAMMAGLLSLTMNAPVNLVEALVAVPGLGEPRIPAAIQLWQSGQTVAQHLLIPGGNTNEQLEIELSIERLMRQPFYLTRVRGVKTSPHADNTTQQVDWIVEQVAELGIESLAFMTSPYHLLRAFLALLKGFERAGLEPPSMPIIVPVPLAISLDLLIPELAQRGVNGWDMTPGELKGIIELADKGQIATYAEFRRYYTWLASALRTI